PAVSDLVHLSETFVLEGHVTNGQHFVEHEDFRFQMGRDGEGQAHVHSTGVPLHRRVKELFQPGKGHDLIELTMNLAPPHAQNGPVEENILAPCQLWMEARSHLEEAPDPAIQYDASVGWRRYLAEHLQQRGFSGAVPADDAYNLPRLHFKA